MRTPKVDSEQVLKLLREGSTPTEIAAGFRVTRQAIDLYRRRFIRQNLLDKMRVTRKRAYPSSSLELLQNSEMRYIQELLAKRFQEAAEVPKLKSRITELEEKIKTFEKPPLFREVNVERTEKALSDNVRERANRAYSTYMESSEGGKK